MRPSRAETAGAEAEGREAGASDERVSENVLIQIHAFRETRARTLLTNCLIVNVASTGSELRRVHRLDAHRVAFVAAGHRPAQVAC